MKTIIASLDKESFDQKPCGTEIAKTSSRIAHSEIALDSASSIRSFLLKGRLSVLRHSRTAGAARIIFSNSNYSPWILTTRTRAILSALMILKSEPRNMICLSCLLMKLSPALSMINSALCS